MFGEATLVSANFFNILCTSATKLFMSPLGLFVTFSSVGAAEKEGKYVQICTVLENKINFWILLYNLQKLINIESEHHQWK